MTSSTSWLGESRLRLGAAVLFVAIAVFGYLAFSSDGPRLHLDTALMWLKARDCIAGHCEEARQGASELGLTHGAMWTRFLTLGVALGFDVPGIFGVVLVFQALGGAVVTVAAARRSRRLDVAVLALLLYLSLLRAVENNQVLWNPQLSHPCIALFAVAWLEVVTGGGLRMALLAGAAVAFAAMFHVLGLALVPLLALGLPLARSRQGWSFVAGLGVCAALVVADCPEAAVINARALRGAGLLWPFVGLTVAAAAGGFVFRRRWWSLPPESRGPLAAAAAFGAVTLAAQIVRAHAGDHMMTRFELLSPPFAALAIAVLAGAAVDRARRGWPRAGTWMSLAVAAAVLWGGWTSVRGREVGADGQGWRWPEARRLADYLYGRGATYAELFRRLQGPNEQILLATLAALDPAPVPTDADRGSEGSLAVLRLESAAVPAPLPAGWTIVELGGRHVALLRDGHGGLLAEGLEVCKWNDASGETCQIVDRRWHGTPAAMARFLDRRYPQVIPRESCRFQSTGRQTWRVPVDTSGGPRRVLLVEESREGCTWTFAGGGSDVIVAQQSVMGRVEVSAEMGGLCNDRCTPPPMLDGSVDDPVIEAYVDATRRTRGTGRR